MTIFTTFTRNLMNNINDISILSNDDVIIR